MTQLADIRRSVLGAGELLEVIGAMRSLAGMRVQEAQRAVPGVRRYAESLASALRASLSMLNSAPSRTARGPHTLVLCASEHGFVGGFNERLLETALRHPADLLFVIGTRGAVLARERGMKPASILPMPARPDGVPDVINRLADEIYSRVVRHETASVDVMFMRSRPGSTEVTARRLLPFEAGEVAGRHRADPPLHNLEPPVVFDRLAAEYVFARLMRAAIESIASENAARFAAMESAHDHVTRKLAELRRAEHEARQDEITAELLDLITGVAGVQSSIAARPAPGR
jgi:F-type H+-transporting ATPase subunit gamma